MVAFQYPPFGFSSGQQRSLSFSRELLLHGWQPLVLTAWPGSYPKVSHDLDDRIPSAAIVRRAFALDACRHLALAGRSLRWTALPDQWISWWPAAVFTGWRMIQQYRPQAIWSTYPISTAHLIAMTLQRISGLPWIADFRDPMVYEGWPCDSRTRRVRARLEQSVIQSCTRAVFVTDSARELYATRYPHLQGEHLRVIENGYDEEVFSEVEHKLDSSQRRAGPLRLVHSGLLEPEDRNPVPFFEALAQLREEGSFDEGELMIVLRASGSEDIYRHELQRLGIERLVELAPRVAYREALAELLTANGLLLFQGSSCNRQIPAKVYEYLRAKRPIMALVDSSGETARLLHRAGITNIASIDNANEVKMQLGLFINQLRNCEAVLPPSDVVRRYSRQWHGEELAHLLDEVVEEQAS